VVRRRDDRRIQPARRACIAIAFESVERFSGDITRVRDELDSIAHETKCSSSPPRRNRTAPEILATKLAARPAALSDWALKGFGAKDEGRGER
jgi:hypothetical protein